MKDDFILNFHQLLDQLAQEIAAYEDEDQMWIKADGISNTAGNLCFHLIGNLNHFIGFALGNTGYERDRAFEFSVPFIKREDLLSGIQNTKAMISQSIQSIDNLAAPYPQVPYRQGDNGSIGFQLMRLQSHLGYHLGQINYHRRLLAPGQSETQSQ